MTATKRNRNAPRSRVSKARSLLIYVFSVPLVVASIGALMRGSFLDMLANMGGLALVVLAARATSQGLEAEAVYDARKIARPPRLPMKLAGGLCLAAASGLVAGISAGHGLIPALGFAAATLVGHTLFFGFDPRKTKGQVGGHGFTPDEVAEAVDEALAKIAAIQEAARRIKVREFNARLGRICDIARRVVSNIEEDPADLRRARKFLNIYLNSAGQVTEKYAINHQRADDAELEHNFRTLLVNMENAFEDQHEKLLRNDKLDLDVEIEVLSDQLRREGIG